MTNGVISNFFLSRLTIPSYIWLFIFSIFYLLPPVYADQHQETASKAISTAANGEEEQLVSYPASFFMRYQPATALDMVQQLPGFLIDNGASIRGFGNTVGNVLINDKYPSAKQVSPTSILSRIPASQVEKVELIRGQVRGINLQGQSVLANIILRPDIPASIQWELGVLYSSSNSPLKPGLNASLTDRWRSIDYNLGIDIQRGSSGETGPELVFDGEDNLIEERYDELVETGLQLRGIFFNSSAWLGDTFIRSNTKIGRTRGPEFLTSTRKPLTPDSITKQISIKYSEFNPTFEQGIDAERSINNELVAKAILLFTRRHSQFITRQKDVNLPDELTLYRVSESKRLEKEGIARVEFDWIGIKDHVLQFNAEGAINTLDGFLSQTRDTGDGPISVEIPGANSKVKEIRGDFLIKDTWRHGDFELDYGLGAEISRITQTGDIDLERELFYFKPQAVITYSSKPSHLIRLMLVREVSQLNFNDFVSSSVFEDNDLALGNPELIPERTWVSEISNEWRSGQDSVFTLGLYYHRINDVEDLLPLTSDFEVPGNIDDGTRWGVKFESTVPLHWIGLDNAKLDIKLRWQDSSVTDPVTGNSRQLTATGGFSGVPNIRFIGENKYVFDIAYRQDFQNVGAAWGWDIAQQGKRPRFKVNELETYNEGLETNVFIETTRWFGIKARVEGRNLLNYNEIRDRIIYVDKRGLSPVESRILRKRHAGWRLNLVLSGNF